MHFRVTEVNPVEKSARFIFYCANEKDSADEAKPFHMHGPGGTRTHNLQVRRTGALSIELQDHPRNLEISRDRKLVWAIHLWISMC